MENENLSTQATADSETLEGTPSAPLSEVVNISIIEEKTTPHRFRRKALTKLSWPFYRVDCCSQSSEPAWRGDCTFSSRRSREGARIVGILQGNKLKKTE